MVMIVAPTLLIILDAWTFDWARRVKGGVTARAAQYLVPGILD